jgi:hypothetical protein
LIAGSGVSVQHVSAGTYSVTITSPACAQRWNAPTVAVSDVNPASGQSAGAFPATWVQDTGPNERFTVYTGVVVGGMFTATDHIFNLQDVCG